MTRLTKSKAFYELLSSMRFAVSLLSVLAVASIIGTVLKQDQAYSDYLFQFGQFWFSLFEAAGLFDVYHTLWFLLILLFLVVSTGLCIYRNGPSMVKEMKSFREHAQEASLNAFAHRAECATGLDRETVRGRLTRYLGAHGYRFKIQERDSATLIAAKTGSYQRLGYIFAHAGIVVICLGGLIDGNLPFKAEIALGQKKIETRNNIPENQVPGESRLPAWNISFRANVSIPENGSADVTFVSVADGYLVQELPFVIGLKKFHIEHYTTGQPKDFASDVVITDKETGESFARTIHVNDPLVYRGIAVYQASFEDGGTRIKINGWDLASNRPDAFTLEGQVRKSTSLSRGGAQYTVEFTDFRPFNVENFAQPVEGSEQSFMKRLESHLGSAARTPEKRDLRNVGPSFQYKLRDAQGQAREFNNYMLPIELDGRRYFLSGVRATPNEEFRFIRFPVDEDDSLLGYMRLRSVLLDPGSYREIAARFSAASMKGEAISETLRSKLGEATVGVLEMFAGGGFEALAEFLKKKVPQPQQEKTAEIYIKILEGSAFEALQLARERAGLKPLEFNESNYRFLRDSLNSVSDGFSYGAPVYLQLGQYEQVQASGLQLTRSPGKYLVYGGSALLVLGIFALFYVRERRIWLLVKRGAGGVLFAMAANRHTLDFENEFATHREALTNLLKE